MWNTELSVTLLSCDFQVIVDLGHVTFGSVADWSEEQERTLEQGIPLSTPTLEEEEDDDGKF